LLEFEGEAVQVEGGFPELAEVSEAFDGGTKAGGGAEAEGFGTDKAGDKLLRRGGSGGDRPSAGDLAQRGFEIESSVREEAEDFCGEEVCFADEAGDEGGSGIEVEFLGGADLLEAAVAHDCQGLGHGESFFLVVGYVECGNGSFAMDACNFFAHFEAELGVEVAEGFVKEDEVGANDEGPCECDSLLLSAGELAGPAMGVLRHSDHFEGLTDAAALFVTGQTADVEAVCDVLGDGHVRPEGVVLEDHADVAFVRGDEGDAFVVEVYFAAVEG